MQEMSLLLQKEKEPEQEKNQQAPGLPCVPTVWWGGDGLLLWCFQWEACPPGVVGARDQDRAEEVLWKPSQRFMERK